VIACSLSEERRRGWLECAARARNRSCEPRRRDPAERPELAIDVAHIELLTEAASRIREAANAQGFSEVDPVAHFGAASPGASWRSFALSPGSACDRSPCGAGTSAKLTCFAADGKLAEHEQWLQEPAVGSRFSASYRGLDHARRESAPSDFGRGARHRGGAAPAGPARSVLLCDSLMARRRIVVIGAGVVGLCIAHYAQQRGHEVVVVERERDGGDSCSLGNAGLVSPSHFVPLAEPGKIQKALSSFLDSRSPFYLKPRLDPDLIRWGFLFLRASLPARARAAAPILRDLLLASRALHVGLAAELGDAQQLATRGLFMLCRTQAGLDEEAQLAERARALGIETELCTPARAAALDPGARMQIAGAVHYPGDAHLVPMRLVPALVEALRERAELRWRHEVTDWRIEAGRVVSVATPHGEIAGDEFVLAGGSWSAGLLRRLGVRLPLEAGKGYSLTHPSPRQLPRIPAVLAEASMGVTPMGGALRLAGTMEISGIGSPDLPERIRQLVDGFVAYFPDFRAQDFAALAPWRGLRPCSADGLPYVGRLARFENLCVATGHAMLGVTLAPITGVLIAQLLSGEPPSLPLGPLDPNRYA
jgi:D-amino-acid dehydrogenase